MSLGCEKALMIAQCDQVSFTTWDAWIKISSQSRALYFWYVLQWNHNIKIIILPNACSWISFYMSRIITFILPRQGLIWFVFAALITTIMRWQQKHLAESPQQLKTVLGFDSSYMVLKQCKGLDVEPGSEWLQFGWLVCFLALVASSSFWWKRIKLIFLTVLTLHVWKTKKIIKKSIILIKIIFKKNLYH